MDFALQDRCNAGDISEHGLATARGRLAARLGRLGRLKVCGGNRIRKRRRHSANAGQRRAHRPPSMMRY